jgi:hypothetical protein
MKEDEGKESKIEMDNSIPHKVSLDFEMRREKEKGKSFPI